MAEACMSDHDDAHLEARIRSARPGPLDVQAGYHARVLAGFGTRRRAPRLIPLAVAASLALAGGATILLWPVAGPGTRDVNGDGRVDILDAHELALRGATLPDGTSAVALRDAIVSLDAREGRPG